jgi:pyruvate/2-oxoglutarate dehydrogenase complex dihydrolipoamide acyltransferase (E2) component
MQKLTGWRRVATAMWGPPNDPQIYGFADLDATQLLRFMEEARARGHHLTPTHLVGRGVARAIAAVPDLNVRIMGTRAFPRSSIDVFFITAVRGGHDLSGVKVERADQLSAVAIGEQLAPRARTLKTGKDREFSRTKRFMETMPRPAMRAALRATVLVTEKLQLDVPPLALHRNPFGSAMITSVGMFGLPHGFAPLGWVYDVPLIVLVGEVTEQPVVVNHEVVVRPVIPISATIDHRYADGFHISRAMKAFRAYIEDPAAYEPKWPESDASGEPA